MATERRQDKTRQQEEGVCPPYHVVEMAIVVVTSQGGAVLQHSQLNAFCYETPVILRLVRAL